ncbi:MAG: sn-glycerol-1-phosphate dehydrogenase [Sphaerochaetaceae bacterium]|jgi:glycerol-1-phosphate dehydrogenase [NAD(P)+]|nr:sn-glycerol-1-phosphate dehydrogenase [Sphaerochaetaceae bacterium]NLO60174.1 sn-glycerol-1-phosphate dehydrogenase [Spirochaetales bacterium]MDD2405818.1 sn-glycerol-1-phosphate dehydrogenase [Sphaerochaetaceae bacterium]MDD4260011.1 sn-glycerol-1-phosphate dehydrogenase [Sphaerochaetaceae bacterium]MDD4841163.1 sn-glycerol-1-phosphate dehydrogenase [Sphaerochaetaceae bacterium]
MESQYVIAQGALKQVPQLYRDQWGDIDPFVIADKNTFEVAGNDVFELFKQAGYKVRLFVFADDDEVYADNVHVDLLKDMFLRCRCIPVAVGSGTINDIVKLAAHQTNREYMCVPTAPSVDGYTAFGSAITVDGFKQTVFCPAPVWVVADSTILANAPMPMIASGYGDMAAKVPAGADWMIAEAVKEEPIVPHLWAMVQHPLKDQLAHPEKLVLRDMQVIEKLFLGLVNVGNAMQEYHDSRPASGAEHLMSHVWEMEHLKVGDKPVSHGFKVGFATLITTAMIELLCEYTNAELERIIMNEPIPNWNRREAMIREKVGSSPLLDIIIQTSFKKFLDQRHWKERKEHLISQWDDLVYRIKGQLIPFKVMKDKLATAGCPTEPADINLDRNRMRRGIYVAQMIRVRYTVLDLAYECGLFDRLVEHIVDTDTYFSRFSSD